MLRALLFIVGGYLSGSILFAQIVSEKCGKPSVLRDSKDGNPGVANAFQYGGFWCGSITLLGDLCKGILPVYFYQRTGGDFSVMPVWAALVLAAPVLGHILPIFYGFQGGKGIAVTFGCLLGLFPNLAPGALLAGLFILFSCVLRITPHFHRTIITYIAACIILCALRDEPGVVLGFFLIALMVCVKLHRSKEKRETMKVRFLWMR